MKYIVLINMFLILFSSCINGYSENECDICDIQGNWIFKYNYQKDGSKNLLTPTRIVNFYQDSINVFNFFSYQYQVKKEKTKIFQINNKLLTVKNDQITDSINIIKLSNDTLILGYKSHFQVFEKLPKYEEFKSKEILKTKLINQNFLLLPNNFEIDFSNQGIFTTSNFNNMIGLDQYWRIEQYEKEIFLVLDDFTGDILHLQKYDSDTIHFQHYGEENKALKLIRRKTNTVWNKNQLIGNWEENLEKIPPPNYQNNKEILIISDSLIYQTKFGRKDKFKWRFNKNRDKLIFYENWNKIDKRQWNIVKLTKDKLSLQRRLKHRNTKNEIIENIEFIRKK